MTRKATFAAALLATAVWTGCTEEAGTTDAAAPSGSDISGVAPKETGSRQEAEAHGVGTSGPFSAEPGGTAAPKDLPKGYPPPAPDGPGAKNDEKPAGDDKAVAGDEKKVDDAAKPEGEAKGS